MADENIGIRVQVDGGETSIRTLRDLIRYRDELNSNRDLHILNTERLKQDVITARNNLESLRKVRDELLRSGQKGTSEWKQNAADIKQAEAALRSANVELRNAGTQTGIYNDELRRVNATIKEQGALQKEAAKEAEAAIQSQIRGVEALANAFEKIGDVSGYIGKFSASIGNAFSDMSKVFQTNFLESASNRISELITDAFVGHGKDVIARADILNTFEDYMALTGVSADQANAALDKVDQSRGGVCPGVTPLFLFRVILYMEKPLKNCKYEK